MISKQLSVVAIIVLVLGVVFGIGSIWVFGDNSLGGSEVTFLSFVIGIGIAFSSYITFLIMTGLSKVVAKHEITTESIRKGQVKKTLY